MLTLASSITVFHAWHLLAHVKDLLPTAYNPYTRSVATSAAVAACLFPGARTAAVWLLALVVDVAGHAQLPVRWWTWLLLAAAAALCLATPPPPASARWLWVPYACGGVCAAWLLVVWQLRLAPDGRPRAVAAVFTFAVGAAVLAMAVLPAFALAASTGPYALLYTGRFVPTILRPARGV